MNYHFRSFLLCVLTVHLFMVKFIKMIIFILTGVGGPDKETEVPYYYYDILSKSLAGMIIIG